MQLAHLQEVGITHIVCVKHPGKDVFIRANFPEHFRYCCVLLALNKRIIVSFIGWLKVSHDGGYRISCSFSDILLTSYRLYMTLVPKITFWIKVMFVAQNVVCIVLSFYSYMYISALTLLVGHQEEHLACKNWAMGVGVVICLELGAAAS